jgi:hypothetical protein
MRTGIAALLVLFLAGACYKDLVRETDTVYYKPTYSIPIGPLSYTLEDIMPPVALDSLVQDTASIPDSIPLIWYNDEFFFINPPAGHDTSIVELFDISSFSEDAEYTRSLMIRVNYVNGLPVAMEYQLFFLDANDIVLDSMFLEGPLSIDRAGTDENGLVIAPNSGRVERFFDTDDIPIIMQTRKIQITIHLDTYREDEAVLRLFSTDGIDLELAMRAGLVVPIQ